jgi:hypothetical protein
MRPQDIRFALANLLRVAAGLAGKSAAVAVAAAAAMMMRLIETAETDQAMSPIEGLAQGGSEGDSVAMDAQAELATDSSLLDS